MLKNRQPLSNNSTIIFGDKNYRILELISENGGSCLVYKAEYQRGNFPVTNVVIKEFYPKASSLSRYISRNQQGELIVADAGLNKFNKEKKRFIDGIAKQTAFYDNSSNHAMMGFPDIYEKSGTVYSILGLTKGVILSETRHSKFTVCEVSQIMISLCNAVKKLHDKSLLYLDIKPDNVFLLDKEINESRRIALFDFDTVIEKENIPAVGFYSEGWSPNEQEFWQTDEISENTDIYAIGILFYYLITGKKATDELSTQILQSNFSFLNKSSIPADWTNTVSDVKKILTLTLQAEPNKRIHDIGKLIVMFRELDNNSETSSENKPISEGINELNKRIEKMNKERQSKNKFIQTYDKPDNVINIGKMTGDIKL